MERESSSSGALSAFASGVLRTFNVGSQRIADVVEEVLPVSASIDRPVLELVVKVTVPMSTM